MFIKSEDDYRDWVKYNKDKNFIEDVTQRLDEWENKDNVPFQYRPSFGPIWTRDDLNEWVTEFESKKWDFIEPSSMKKYFEEDSDE
jgi:hypothetical protein